MDKHGLKSFIVDVAMKSAGEKLCRHDLKSSKVGVTTMTLRLVRPWRLPDGNSLIAGSHDFRSSKNHVITKSAGGKSRISIT